MDELQREHKFLLQTITALTRQMQSRKRADVAARPGIAENLAQAKQREAELLELFRKSEQS